MNFDEENIFIPVIYVYLTCLTIPVRNLVFFLCG